MVTTRSVVHPASSRFVENIFTKALNWINQNPGKQENDPRITCQYSVAIRTAQGYYKKGKMKRNEKGYPDFTPLECAI